MNNSCSKVASSFTPRLEADFLLVLRLLADLAVLAVFVLADFVFLAIKSKVLKMNDMVLLSKNYTSRRAFQEGVCRLFYTMAG
jgi:hypothetical protein